jgi:hypothetical protein
VLEVVAVVQGQADLAEKVAEVSQVEVGVLKLVPHLLLAQVEMVFM